MSGWNDISVKGIGEILLTLKKNGIITAGTHEGMAAKIPANKEVAVGTADTPLAGKIKAINGDEITVQIAGIMELPYTGTAPTVGTYAKLECGAGGAVQVDVTNGKEFLVLDVDATNSKVTIWK